MERIRQSRYLLVLVIRFTLPIIAMALPLVAQSSGSYAITVEYQVPVKMRDGVTLYADIYRAKTEEKLPVLLVRTPYDKSRTWVTPLAHAAASRGFVVIIQDVRGRYESEGEWYPFRNESNDGYETVEWAAALPYTAGKVGMIGGSYVGATQFLAAISHPRHLAGICPVVTGSNYHDGWTYQGGAFEQFFNETWTSGLAQDTLRRRLDLGNNAMSGIDTLPLTSYPVLKPDVGGLAPYF